MLCNFDFCDTTVPCCSSVQEISEIDRETADSLLSEVGLLFSDITKRLGICNTHYNVLLTKNRSKRKSVRCAITAPLAQHRKTVPKAERHISREAMLKIHSKTGTMFSIGTRK